MAKKTWIKIKRGILDPEHRKTLGIRVWLYMYMLDIVNWETGTIDEWRDKYAADDLDMPWRTIQDQRQHLESDGYITCKQSFQCLRIIIHKWTDPRKYSGEVINIHSTESSVSPIHGTEFFVPATSGEDLSTKEGHGTDHDTEHPAIKFRTPIKEILTSNIKDKDLKDKELKDSEISKKPRGHNAVRKALGEEFAETTGLSPPPETTARAKRAAGALWWQPLRAIAILTDWNQEQGIALIRLSVKRMRKGKLTISDPNSILKTTRAIMGEVKSGLTALDARSQREQRQAVHRAESDRHAEKRRRRIHAQDMARRMEDSEEGQGGTD